MILNYITQAGNRKFFSFIIYIMIFTFSLTISGCYSTQEQIVKPENLNSAGSYKIIKAIMKNGLTIDLRGKQATYAAKYHDMKNVIVYTSSDTAQVQPGIYNTSSRTYFIDINQIQSLQLEREEMNTELTVIAVICIAAAVVGVTILIINALNPDHDPSPGPPAPSSHSCPFIYSFNGQKYVFDAEPYGGSVTEGLKKTDYSRLEDLIAGDGKYKLLMRNETDETQYTDELKLLVVDHPVNTDAVPDVNGTFSVFEKALQPVSVTDENEKDITLFFRSKDNLQWQTEMPVDENFKTERLKHELIFKFPKPENAKRVKLLLNAGTSLWGEYMLNEMLINRGDKVDDWYKDVNRKGPELFRLYEFVEREGLYIMKANVLESGSWTGRGTVAAGGPYIDEDRIIELNIENVTGDTLCIMLNPPYGYWKIDYAGVIYESTIPDKITELPVTCALDEKGNDLKSSLSIIDGNYYSMPYLSSSAKIEFDVPPVDKNSKRSLYLKTTGYYEIHLKKDKPEQAELIERVYNTPGLIIELSLKEYIKKLKSRGYSDN